MGASAAAAAVFTHGMVFSAMDLKLPLPASTYQGFFQQWLLATERLWSYAHGWQPMSHIQEFGRFYAPAVQLICPLIGFALFRILSRQKMGIHVYKPMAIALVLAMVPPGTDLAPAYTLPWVEAARTILVLWLMVWSVGALRMPEIHTAALRLASSIKAS